MYITVPPILIPLTLLALIFALGKFWVPAQIKTLHMQTGVSRKAAAFDLVGIPLISFALVAGGLHLLGADSAFSGVIHGLSWCAQGLLWDCLHPFVYGFSISFS